MGYTQNLEKAARRHLNAASHLFSEERNGNGPGNNAVAGYLYGMAGELALK